MIKILLVDDELFILEGLKKLINWEEYGVESLEVASSGKQALEKLEKTDIDILISDVCMEEMTGIELIRVAKQKYENLKCMILSGYDDFQYIKEAMKLGVENYLLKPVKEEELVSSLIQIQETIETEKKARIKTSANEDIIRTNIFLRWINNNIPEKEMKEKSETLNISLHAAAYWVGVFCDTSIVYNMELSAEAKYRKMLQVKEYLTSKFKDDAYIFMNMENQVVAIFKGNPDYYDEIRKRIIRYLEFLKVKENISVYAALGSIVAQYDKVGESYQNALFVIHTNTRAETNTLREWRKDMCERVTLEDLFSIQVEKIKQYVEEKDEKRTGEVMDSFIREICQRGEISYVWKILFLQQMTMNIISCVDYRDNQDLYQQAENILYNIHFCQEEQFGVHVNKLKNLAIETIHYLKNKENDISPIVMDMKKMIEHEYQKELNLAWFGEKYKANPVYLGQLFKNEVGEYFSDYLNRVRIEKAKNILSTTKISVSEVGIQVGYASKTHFFSNFKKITGMTPMEYRRGEM